jgi:hypothetical protein
MNPDRYKALACLLFALFLLQCGKSASLQIDAQPSRRYPSFPDNRNRNVPDQKTDPGDKTPEHPAIQASDTLLPKLA